ncbi:MAG: PAS domain-containing protein [Desulfocapsaceae bacterium]|jgi:DUF438 domain-containing protein|nr:PAS domain-containing protein [Desulfocapsaceae bacterium]
MNETEVLKGILNSIPYPIVYVDLEHIIRFMNNAAVYHYCTERGHEPLVGRSIFSCHKQEKSKDMIIKTVERFKSDAKEKFLQVSDRNLRIYITPVKNDRNELIGYYERFENNFAIHVTETK